MVGVEVGGAVEEGGEFVARLTRVRDKVLEGGQHPEEGVSVIAVVTGVEVAMVVAQIPRVRLFSNYAQFLLGPDPQPPRPDPKPPRRDPVTASNISEVPRDAQQLNINFHHKLAARDLTMGEVVTLVDNGSATHNFYALAEAWKKNGYQKPTSINFSPTLTDDLKALVLYTDLQSKGNSHKDAQGKFDVLMIGTTCDYDRDWMRVNYAIFNFKSELHQ